MTILAAAACGLVIGLVLGALGGGGSILAVPALVYVLGQSAQEATTTSLIVIGLSSIIGALSYHRDRHVRWGVGLAFGVVGIVASCGGTVLNRNASDTTLLASFAAVMAVSSVAMIVRAWRHDDPAMAADVVPATPTHFGSDTTVMVKTKRATKARSKIRPRTAVQVVVSALLVGFLTGFLGVGGGFIVVPALVMLLGYPMPVAAGTSLFIITLNSAASLGLHADAGLDLDPQIIIPFTAATVVASLAGKRIASKCSSRTLTLAFAMVLLLVAVGIGAEVAVSHLAAN